MLSRLEHLDLAEQRPRWVAVLSRPQRSSAYRPSVSFPVWFAGPTRMTVVLFSEVADAARVYATPVANGLSDPTNVLGEDGLLSRGSATAHAIRLLRIGRKETRP